MLKFTVTKTELNKVLPALKSVRDKNHIKAALGCVQISTGDYDNSVVFSVTDAEMSVRLPVSVGIDQDGDGAVLVNLEAFAKVISKSKQKTFLIKEENGKLMINTIGDNYVTIPIFTGDDYPEMFGDAIHGSYPIGMNADRLHELISTAIVSTATQDAKESYKAMHIRYAKDSLTLATTNGNRLSEASCKVFKQDVESVIMVKADHMKKAMKILAKLKKGHISFEILDRCLLITSREMVVIINKFDVQFPEYKKVLPALKWQNHVYVNREELKNVMAEIIPIIDGQENFSVKLESGEQSLKVSNPEDDAEIGFDYTLDAEYEQDEFLIRVDPSYLFDALKTCDSEKVALEIISEREPLVIRTDDSVHLIGSVRKPDKR